jgi:hypothetical protein
MQPSAEELSTQIQQSQVRDQECALYSVLLAFVGCNTGGFHGAWFASKKYRMIKGRSIPSFGSAESSYTYS